MAKFEAELSAAGLSAGAEVGATKEGVTAGVDVSASPSAAAAASGVAGAVAYNWLASMLGAGTGPLLVAVGVGVLLYQKAKAKKQSG